MARPRKVTAQEGMNELREAEEKVKKPVKEFNFSNYQIAAVPETKVVVIEETGDEFDIKIKNLSWSRRNQILSRALKWGEGGQTSFDGDAYVRACLKEMIIEAPWGTTSEAFLMSIDERLGNALESVVPAAFGSNDDSITMEDSESLKNG